MTYKEKEQWVEEEITGEASTIPKDEKTDDQTTDVDTGNRTSGGETGGGGVGYQYSQGFLDLVGGGSVDFTVGDSIAAAKKAVDAAEDGVEEESDKRAAGVQGLYAGFYNQYKRMYMDAADRNYRGAYADAALLTGGYGNSYGAYMGKEAYDDTMSAFYASAPGLYEAAEGFYEQGAGGKAFADAKAALDSAEGDLTTAIKEEQTRAAEKYFSEYQKGNMSLDAVKAALAGLVAYTDSEGNAVYLFTEEEINVLAEAFAKEMEGQKTGKETAIEKEQASAFEHYLDLIAAGKMTWEEAAEAMDGLTYTDADGNTVDFFTEEDMKKWESEYNDIVAKQEAARQAAAQQEAGVVNGIIDVIAKDPSKNTDTYIINALYQGGLITPGMTQEEIDGLVEDVRSGIEPVNDLKKPDEDILSTAAEIALTKGYDDLMQYLDELVIMGIDSSEIMNYLKKYYPTVVDGDKYDNRYGNRSVDEEGNVTWHEEPKTYDGGVYYYEDGGETVFVTLDQIYKELLSYGYTEEQATAWITYNLEAYIPGKYSKK